MMLGVGYRVKALVEQRILAKYTLLSGQVHAILRKINPAGNIFVAMEVLGEIQCQIQAVTVFQLHDTHPFFQPVGFSLPLFRPDIAEVNGVANQFSCGVILIENVGDLRKRAIHIHRHTLIQCFCLQGIQPEKQLIRVGGIHVFACVGESDPDTLHIVPAYQFDPNCILTGDR